MYPRNAASPPLIFAKVVNASTGAPITSGVTVYLTVGTDEGPSSGAARHEGNGFWSYAPLQAETDYAAFGVDFYHADAVGDGPGVSVVTTPIDSNGLPSVSLKDILDTALTESVAGYLAAAFKKFFDKAAPTGTINSLPDAVAGASNGLLIAGTNAAVTISSASGSALTVSSTGGNGDGLTISGNGSGHGVRSTGGTAGEGIRAIGSDAGLYCTASAGHGIAAVGVGTGSGIVAQAGTTGYGLDTLGGSGSGAGIRARAQANNDAGLLCVKHGTGKDIDADQLDSILEDTAVIGAAGAGLTAIPWNATWDAEVQSECTDALNAYDPPTNAEMELRTLAAADYATATNLATVAGYLDSEIAAILEDTGTTLPAQIAALNNLSAAEVNAEVLDCLQVDTPVDGKTIQSALRIIAAGVLGKVSGAGTGTEVFLGLDGLTTRATVTADEDGNRRAVTFV